MSISKGFRYKDEKGKVTDYEYGVNGSNVTQDANHRLVTDEEKKKWNGKADPEDIPSGSAASYSVANNDTTTQAGFVADARIVKQHGDEIDQLSSEFQAWFGVTEDGQRGWKEPGADAVIPFRKVEYIGNITGKVSSNRRYADFDITSYDNYQNITVDNIFPVITYMMHSSNGDGAGAMSWSYKPDSGILTFDNGDASMISVKTKIYVI